MDRKRKNERKSMIHREKHRGRWSERERVRERDGGEVGS